MFLRYLRLIFYFFFLGYLTHSQGFNIICFWLIQWDTGGCCFEYFLHNILRFINFYTFMIFLDYFYGNVLLLLTIFIVIHLRFIHERPARMIGATQSHVLTEINWLIDWLAAISMIWNTNMAAVTSCENAW